MTSQQRTRVRLGRRADLGADCARCLGLCCVTLTFIASSDFPVDKPAGEPCVNLADDFGCRIHGTLREHGFKGCTVFDCFGAGQKVSARFGRGASVFPVVRRLHELLWYLDEAISLVPGGPARWVAAFDRVEALSNGSAEQLAALDVDAEYDAARPLLIEASSLARSGHAGSTVHGPGSDLAGARLAGADLSGACLRGSSLLAADLTGARLTRCDLLGVDLRDADLSGADLREAIFLTQMQVNSARGDASTLLPSGFERPAHWR